MNGTKNNVKEFPLLMWYRGADKNGRQNAHGHFVSQKGDGRTGEAMRWFQLPRFESLVVEASLLVSPLALFLPTHGEGGMLLDGSHQQVRTCVARTWFQLHIPWI